jgi:hypothetical protein
MQVLFLILILSTAMLLGNEFSVAIFIHPAPARKQIEESGSVIETAECVINVLPQIRADWAI